MLSLAFGEVIVEWKAIKNSIDREAVAISDTYINLKYLTLRAPKRFKQF